MARERKLYRDTTDQKIGGVCAGLARYFDLDPLLVRVAFVAGIFFNGVSLIAYPLLWWLVDPAPDGHWSDQTGETLPPPATTSATTTDSTDSESTDSDQAAA